MVDGGQEMSPSGDNDGASWVTINGAHVYINDRGESVTPISLSGCELGSVLTMPELQIAARNYALSIAGKRFRNVRTGMDIEVSKKSMKKVTAGQYLRKLQAVVAIPNMIQQAEHVSSNLDSRDGTGSSIIHRFHVPIVIDGARFDAKLVVKESRNGRKYYDHNLSEIK